MKMHQVRISLRYVAGEHYVQQSFTPSSRTWWTAGAAASIRELFIAAIVTVGCWPWWRAALDKFPKCSISNPDLIAKPLVSPEFWREVSLTVKGGRIRVLSAHSCTRQMRSAWLGDVPLAVKNLSDHNSNAEG
jgi:hypothetical protein